METPRWKLLLLAFSPISGLALLAILLANPSDIPIDVLELTGLLRSQS